MNDQDYALVATMSGYAVRRQDGALAEFMDSASAEEAVQLLDSGRVIENDFCWSNIGGD